VAARKTNLRVDDELIARAAAILGTHGIKETVDAALRAVLVTEARRRVVEQLRSMDRLELDNAEVMAGAWRD
jgi:Arc/MetJ family transcription regulator